MSFKDFYSERFQSAFANRALISEVGEMFHELWKDDSMNFSGRVKKFAGVIEQNKADAESLAKKYRLQMLAKHKIEIDTRKVALLVDKAAAIVNTELEQFFSVTGELVKNNITSFTQGK